MIALALLVAGAVELTPCELTTPGLPRMRADCGSIVVDDGAHIGFAVLAATGHKKAPDPLVLLPGGPGQAFTDLAGFAELEFGAVRRTRDLILFDPRGTGRSGKLHCRDGRSLAERLRADDAEESRRLAGCAADLALDTAHGRSLDPKSITTARIVMDLEAVRAALGVTTWNLAGVSYGTRLALAYDRAYPGKARALVLDSVVPFSMVVGADAGKDADAALAALDARAPDPRVVERAARDAAMAALGLSPSASPLPPAPPAPSAPPTLPQSASAGDGGVTAASLTAIVRRLVRELDANPRDVVIAHPATGAPVSLRLDGKMLAGAVRVLLYADQGAAILPPLLRAADAGDLSALAAQLFVANDEQETIAGPMQLSVLCAEDVPYIVDDDVERASPFGGFHAQMTPACAAWPHAEVPRTFHADLPASTTPALLLAGDADPITPPRFLDAAQITLPHARAVVTHGLGHNSGAHGCLPELIGRFLGAPNAAAPAEDAACIKSAAPFPAFADKSGPAP